MGYYLLDNPPRSPQFYPSRNSTPTYAIGVHTSEGSTGPGSARNLARFISQRSDPGSYHAIVDSEETVVLVPPDYTTFSVAASGYNSRTWHICLAGRSADLSPDDANTQAMIARAGEAIRALWGFLGIDPAANAQWIGTDALNRPGLFCHGDVQPWDRSDAWSRHPDRARLDQLLIDAITPTTPPEDEMKTFLLVDRRFSPAPVYNAFGNTKVWLSKQEEVDCLKFLGWQVVDPAPPHWVDALATLPRDCKPETVPGP
jgi:hypothetical protein